MQNAVTLAFLAGIFTLLMTALGSSAALFLKDTSQKLLDSMLGFAAGIMIAASFFSLLMPAIELSAGMVYPWFPAVAGFLAGGIFLKGLDTLVPHMHVESGKREGASGGYSRLTLFALAVTIHNVPEGMAVGVAFGGESLNAAVALAIGIGIQNVPEGFAISMPLRFSGYGRVRSFLYGVLSAVVEPVFAVTGAYAVVHASVILPFALAFAAGAMIYVVIEDIVPEAESHGNEDLATMAAMLGFTVMMLLDLALG